MATLANLIAQVKSRIPTPVPADTTITDRLNLGVLQIAGGVLSPDGSYITPPLPDLFEIDTVDTSTTLAYVAMPSTFHRNLQFVAGEDGMEIDIYNSMIEFAEDYPLMDGSGSVKAVIEQGGYLYYQDIPTSVETLTLHYFRLPVDMSASSDVPDGIPSHLAEPLLVNFACIKIYELQRVPDQNKIIWHTNLFNEALRKLELTIPVDGRSLFLGD